MQTISAVSEEREFVLEKKAVAARLWSASEEPAEIESVRRKLVEFEKMRIYDNEDLTRLVRKSARTSLHMDYETRLFYQRLRQAQGSSGSEKARQAVTSASPCVPDRESELPRATGRKHKSSKLKRMQRRNFITTFFANLIFIPRQLVSGVFAFVFR